MDENEMRRPQEIDAAASSRGQVLIADPHVDSRRLISMALIGSAYEVVAEAQDGVEAAIQAITLQPDVVLIGLDLPKLDADSTASLLRALPGRMILLALSPETRECPAWADAFVLKEDLGTLRTTLDYLLPRAREHELARGANDYDAGPPSNYEFVSAAVRALSSDLDPVKSFSAFSSLLREMVSYRELSLYKAGEESFQRIVGLDDSGLLPVEEEQSLLGSQFERPVQYKEPEFTQRFVEERASDAGSGRSTSRLVVPLTRNAKVFALIEVIFSGELEEQTPAVVAIKQLAPALTQAVINLLSFQDLRERAADLELADEGKKALLSLFSHDLRIPLSLILGFAGALKQHWAALPEGKRVEAVDVIHRNSKQLASMIEEGFEIVMAESGELSFDIAPFNLGDLAKTIAQDFAGTVDVPVRVHVPSNLPPVKGDARRTWRVIANLVTNAVKYGDGGPVRLVVKSMGHEVHLSVIDQGSGINAADLVHLFERHYRVPEAEKSGTTGLGMGLYICKTLIEGQGGRIWVESKRFEGSTFTFALPVAEPEELQERGVPEQVSDGMANGTKKKSRVGFRHTRQPPRVLG